MKRRETEFGSRLVLALRELRDERLNAGQEADFGPEEVASRARVNADAVQAVFELLKAGHDPYRLLDGIDLRVYYTQ